ncbi:response regulator [Terrabacter carboxydivorans]|uniref:histidine kinase n=1 Tax=Terrabacter carboxydivorans TaxID=619730 RepID=A0ABN3MJT6_9MICO
MTSPPAPSHPGTARAAGQRRSLPPWFVAAVALPLLVVATALTGFAGVQHAHEDAIRLLTAQRYQQNADMLDDAIYGDVLAAVLNAGPAASSPAALPQSVGEHVTALTEDLRRLDEAALPGSVTAALHPLQRDLQSYVAQAETLADLAVVDHAAARGQLPAFERLYRSLTQPEAALTAALSAEAASRTVAADDRQSRAVAWTSLAAAAVLAAMLSLAVLLYRRGRHNEALLRDLQVNGEQLAHSNQQLHAAQQLAHIGSWQWDTATGVTDWSEEFYRILGLDPDTPGSHEELFAARVHPEDLPEVMQARARAAQSQADVGGHYRIVRPDGAVREVVAHGRALSDEHGKVVRLVGTMQDVTEQRALERMKDEFVGVISHELRTPLTSIRGALGLIASGAVGTLPPKAQRMADVALSSCERLVRLVNDILDVEKMAAGKLELDLAPLAASDVIAAATQEMQAMADQAGVTLTARPGGAVVLADRDRVTQALTNLISNAIKFSPPGGTVLVSAGPAQTPDTADTGQSENVKSDGELVQFTVTDQGSGIPADQVEAVFDRFIQADASDTRAKGGTGLGLPICRGIVEQHGGRIWATSEPDRGGTFTFTLPAAADPGQATDAARDTGPLPVGAVLICDDDPAVVEVLAEMLESHGYETLRAHSGPEALTLAADQAPGLILMDLRMPGMSGWEAIAALGADPATVDIPIVILSALAPDDIAVPSASSWLTKPIDQHALMSSLRRALGSTATTSVLIVEDDEELAEVLRAFFTDHGIHTRVARTGEQALAMSREVPPDLLVLDLGLPDLNGYEVVAAMRHDNRLRSLPLLVYTGADLTADDRRRLRLGETRFVSKSGPASTDFARQVISLLHQVTTDA